MHRLGALVHTLDSSIQRRFDSAIHRLMHRGLTKRTLRKSGHIAYLSSWVMMGGAVFATPEHELLPMFSVILLFIVTSGFLCMRADEDQDAAAERSPGTMSLADTPTSARVNKQFGVLFFGLAVCGATFHKATHRPDIAFLLTTLLLGMSCLYLGYLVRTPPASPKPKTNEAPDALPSYT